MATPVEMPKLGNTVEECILSRWVRRKGETVAMGDIVAEIETDKTTFEVTAPVAGTVLETFFEEGALVPVFTNIFVIGDAGENVDSFRPADAPVPVAEPLKPSAPIVENRANGALTAAPMSPRASRFAAEHKFYPAAVAGSGPGGRILEQDLRELYSRAQRDTTMRNRIARRMRESLATTAQYTLHSSADAAGLLSLRASFKASPATAEINVNDLVAFCAMRALQRMPELNAEYVDGKILPHAEIHLGFACDTPRGLMVPVIRNAGRFGIRELAAAAKDLAARAVQGSISPDDLTGATFTVSNLGALGVESFTPVLNPPQVAILGVGSIQTKPIRRNGNIDFVDVIGLSLTCDHQVIDGAPAARFLAILREQIEQVGQAICLPDLKS